MSSPHPWQRVQRGAGSLKFRLAVIGVLLVAASVAVTVWWVLRDVGRHSEQIALDGQHAQVQRQARAISGELVQLQLALRSIAAAVAHDRVGDAQAMTAYLRDRPVLTTLFSSAFVALADGRVVALADATGVQTPGYNVAERSFHRMTLQQRRPIISEAGVSPTSGEPVVVLTMPILDDHGAIVAMLGGGLRLASRGLMREATDAGENDDSLTVVADARGRILSHPDPRWLLRDAEAEPRLTQAVQAWVEQGRPVEPSGQAQRFGDELVALAGVPDAEWVVLRSERAPAVLAGLAEGRTRAVQVGLLVALVGGAAMMLATIVLLRPLRRLEQRAHRLLDEGLADDEGWPRAAGELGRLSAVFRRVMRERRSSDDAQRELLDRLQAVMSNSPVGIAFTRDKRFELVSAQFNRLCGWHGAGPDGLAGQPSRVIHASDAFYDELGRRVAQTFAERGHFDEEVELMRRGGGRFWGRLQGAPVRADDPAAGTIWTLDDVTESRRQREALAWNSSHDPLTELVNRREFERRLQEQLDNRRRESASALFIDLDRFKAVNDRAGHAAGDRVLVEVAQLLLGEVRHLDTVARLGGDEFAVLLRHCDRGAAAVVAEKMRAAVERHRLHWNGHALSVGASVGVVELGPELPTLAAVLAAADAACYAAKHAGRNTMRVHGLVA